MAQSGGCSHEALATGGDTTANFGLCITHRNEKLAWPDTQKKKKKKKKKKISVFTKSVLLWLPCQVLNCKVSVRPR